MSSRILEWSQWGNTDIISGWTIGEPGNVGFSEYLIHRSRRPRFYKIRNNPVSGDSIYQSHVVFEDPHYSMLRIYVDRHREGAASTDRDYVTILGFGNSRKQLEELFSDLWEELELKECDLDENTHRCADAAAYKFAEKYLGKIARILGT